MHEGGEEWMHCQNTSLDYGTISDTKLFSKSGVIEFFEILSDPSSLVGEIRLSAVDIEKAEGFGVKYNASGGTQGVLFHVGANAGSRITLDNRGSTDDFLISGSNFELNNGDITMGGDISFTTGSVGQHVKIGKVTNS